MHNFFKTEIYDSNKHDEYIHKWMPYWKSKKYANNSSFHFFKLHRYELTLVTFYKNDLYMVSGLEDISDHIPDTCRVKTRLITTNVTRPNMNGRGLENISLGPALHASVQALYNDVKLQKKNVLFSCVSSFSGSNNKSYRMGKYLNNPRNFSSYIDHTKIRKEKIWDVEQWLYYIDVDFTLDLGENFYGKKEFYNFLKEF